MAMLLESIETKALKLTLEERVVLADPLLSSVTETEVDRAWAIEVARRDKEVDAGLVTLIPADEAIAYARRAIV